MGRTRWWHWKWVAPDPQEVQYIEHIQEKFDVEKSISDLRSDIERVERLINYYANSGKKV